MISQHCCTLCIRLLLLCEMNIRNLNDFGGVFGVDLRLEPGLPHMTIPRKIVKILHSRPRETNGTKPIIPSLGEVHN